MAELKTKQTSQSVTDFLNTIPEEEKRSDCFEILKLVQKVTELPPKMWGPAIIGFGSYHYKYDSGHEGDMCIIGFSPRRQNITLYVGIGDGSMNNLLEKLGKHKTGKGCLYIKKLSDVDRNVLKEIIQLAYANASKKLKL